MPPRPTLRSGVVLASWSIPNECRHDRVDGFRPGAASGHRPEEFAASAIVISTARGALLGLNRVGWAGDPQRSTRPHCRYRRASSPVVRCLPNWHRELPPNVRCNCQSDRHQVVRPSTLYQIRVTGARLAGALQVNFMR